MPVRYAVIKSITVVGTARVFVTYKVVVDALPVAAHAQCSRWVVGAFEGGLDCARFGR